MPAESDDKSGNYVVADHSVDIERPRYDQEVYWGRAKHFLLITNPLNVLASSASLENAKDIVTKYRAKESLPDGTTIEDLWRAKVLYDSAFHPDTGDKMNVIGRMSAQVPMNMLITGGMMAFYKTTPAVIFWQWLNQSFNALVNYTNRGGDSALSEKQLLGAYAAATGGALTTAIGLNSLVKSAPPIVGRFVPFAAVAAANCINIPFMRVQEIQEGTPIFDENNNKLGSSTAAARSGISQVIFSRILMASPGMVFTPFVMNYLERRGTLARYPWITLPVQVGLLGVALTFATPLCCALFKQKATIAVDSLETDLKDKVYAQYNGKPPEYVYFNKGL